eukprot:2298341-Prymnesium_polylepis.1
MRIRPYDPCTFLFPSATAPYALRDREPGTLTVCTPVGAGSAAEEGKAARDVEEPRALRARLPQARQVPEPYSPARGLRLLIPCPTRQSAPILLTTPFPCGAQVSAPMQRWERRSHARRPALGAVPGPI